MVNIAEQSRVFFSLFLVGILAGVMYNFFSVLRAEYKLKKLSPVLDGIFALALLIMFYTALYKSGKGQLRLYAFLGAATGFTVYFLLIGKIFGKWMVISLRFFNRIMSIIFFPFLKIWKFIKLIWMKIVKTVHFIQKNSENFVRKILEKNKKNSII